MSNPPPSQGQLKALWTAYQGVSMTFLKELRDAAMKCSNIDYRAVLRGAADDLDAKLATLTAWPTNEAMIAVNGAWSCAARTLKNIPPEAEPSPLGGDTTPALLARAA